MFEVLSVERFFAAALTSFALHVIAVPETVF